MATTDALRAQLADVEAELAGLDDRRTALEQAAADLRSAIASVDALGGTAAGPSPAPRSRRSTPSVARPTVTPEALLEALAALGGTASVEQLVEALGLPDGRSLNGARRQAVDAGTVLYADRTYTLPE